MRPSPTSAPCSTQSHTSQSGRGLGGAKPRAPPCSAAGALSTVHSIASALSARGATHCGGECFRPVRATLPLPRFGYTPEQIYLLLSCCPCEVGGWGVGAAVAPPGAGAADMKGAPSLTPPPPPPRPGLPPSGPHQRHRGRPVSALRAAPSPAGRPARAAPKPASVPPHSHRHRPNIHPLTPLHPGTRAARWPSRSPFLTRTCAAGGGASQAVGGGQAPAPSECPPPPAAPSPRRPFPIRPDPPQGRRPPHGPPPRAPPPGADRRL
jgi:hypothetical protein